MVDVLIQSGDFVTDSVLILAGREFSGVVELRFAFTVTANPNGFVARALPSDGSDPTGAAALIGGTGVHVRRRPGHRAVGHRAAGHRVAAGHRAAGQGGEGGRGKRTRLRRQPVSLPSMGCASRRRCWFERAVNLDEKRRPENVFIGRLRAIPSTTPTVRHGQPRALLTA